MHAIPACPTRVLSRATSAPTAGATACARTIRRTPARAHHARRAGLLAALS
ncbi:MAG: hypothetical protein KA148_05115 [Ottowia sp.]|uniref:Uncharacterized protein n=1 Tax=Ottowia beijingensis TaxID=1207057 RepID=A0A853IW91_9BURK|nr:hypothetical protein [Ottowia beijingensis]MBP6779900.1 hypothetical protein [Ottowia sp.]MBP9953712.1 hypothetical protein [Ottowia sp.]NZA01470.1 hypothetical protein [Ottowia beijingensis]HRL37500.1 hypothetical protein [Ottowia beijingensis]